MKKYLAIPVAVFCLLLSMFSFDSCKKQNNNGVTVSISSVSPRSGNSGMQITITGVGFLTDASQESVSMGFINAPIVSSTTTQIVVTVPVFKDSAKIDSVPILLSVNSAIVGGGYFTYNNYDVSSFAGSKTAGSINAAGTAASFQNPENGVFDKMGNLYVADYGNNEIRKITPSGIVSTYAGSTTAGFKDGPAAQALFNGPAGLCFDKSGNLYVSDQSNNRIRKIDALGNVSTIAGTGVAGYSYGERPALSAVFNGPIGIAYDSISNMLIVADSYNNVIRAISLGDGTSYTLAGPINGPNSPGSSDETGGNPTLGATFNSPRGIAIYASGNSAYEYLYVYVADYGNNKIREIVSVGNLYNNLNTTSTINTYTIAGNSNNQAGFTNSPSASFSGPNSLCIGYSNIALGGSGTPVLFIADASNQAIRYATGSLNSINGSQLNFETIAGSGLPGLANGSYTSAQFYYPDGVAYNPVDGNLYVIEFGNNDIRKILLQ